MDETRATRRVIRLNALTSDGRPNPDLITLVLRDPISGLEVREDDGTPAAFIRLRPLTKGARDAIVARHTKPDKLPGGRTYERVDQEAVDRDLMLEAIEGWEGIVGADDQPLVCTPTTKPLLPDSIRLQITLKLFGAEYAEVSAESFRES